jgi:MATE family multidrug resistance protein
MNAVEREPTIEALSEPESRSASSRSPKGAIWAETRSTLELAWPVVLAELGWVAMGAVDLIMVGRLGPEAIGAVGLGNIAYFSVVVFGLGLVMGLDTVVSQAFGANRVADCHRWLVQGVYVALATSVPSMIGVALLVPWLPRWGLAPEVVRPAASYLHVLLWGTPPLFLYFVIRRYLQSMNVVRVVTVTLIAANVLNFVGNWLLIGGRWGLPALGVAGSAWSTNLARLAMFLALLAVAVVHSERNGTGLLATSLRPAWDWIGRLLALGGPIAIQFGLEVGVFGIAALLAGRLGPTALAAHEVVLNAASVTFMVPLGIASAGSVRVGQAIGRVDPAGAGRAGWVAVALGAAFMACAGLTFLLVPHSILGLFTDEAAVIRTALPLLVAAALFQLFDGLQVSAGGALRGTGDTRTPMYVNLAAHWTIGLPIGFLLAFPLGWGVVGLWIGLASGLICAGAFLLVCWSRAVGRIGDRPALSVPAP